MAFQKKKKLRTQIYWVITALMLITAMPVGIAMIFAKLFETKKKGKPQMGLDIPLGARTTAGLSSQNGPSDPLAPIGKNARWRIVTGGALTALFLLTLPVSLPIANGFWDIWLLVCCIGVSAAYLLTGVALKGKLKRCRDYLSAIGYRRAVPLSELAAALDRSFDQVHRDLEELLEEGLLAGGSLDGDQLILSSQH